MPGEFLHFAGMGDIALAGPGQQELGAGLPVFFKQQDPETGRCCVARGSYGYVYLTLADRQRLARHFGLSTRDFTRRHCARTDGHWHLRDFTDRCGYLDGVRCRVYEARPEQCRTWPFWPEHMSPKAWSKEVASYCPGVGKGRVYSGPEIVQLLRRDPLR